MPDTWSNKGSDEINIDRLMEQLIRGGRSTPTSLESSSTVLRRKSGGKYDIEANTCEGLKVFKDAVVSDSDYDAQSETDDLLTYWIDAPPEEDDDEDFAPELSASSCNVLHRIESGADSARRQAIIDAEALPFDGDDRAHLIDLLKNYIEQNRDSNDREELIAVAAAIRKCVALFDESDLGWLAKLLESGHRVQPSLDAELEIAKMVVRRYSQSPPADKNPHPELSARLAEIATDYLRPRVFARPRFSTVAMLATQALMVMRAPRAGAVIDQVNELSFAWFRQQLARRMNRILRDMPADTQGMDGLRELIDTIDAN